MHSREPSKLLRSPGQNARPVRGARMTECIKVSIYCGTTYVHTRLSADCIERSFLVRIRDAHRVLPANVRAPISPSAAQGADSVALSCGSAAKNVNFRD